MERYADIVTRLLKYALWHDNTSLDGNVFDGLSVDDWGGYTNSHCAKAYRR